MGMNAPVRIHAKVHGFRISFPDGARRLAGGWDEVAYGGTTEYVRADIVSDMLEALQQALMHIEVDETTHGRNFGAGNVVRAAITKAKAEGGAS